MQNLNLPNEEHDAQAKARAAKCRACAIENPTVRSIVLQPPSRTDPNGSYTGRPVVEGELPQQDADDL